MDIEDLFNGQEEVKDNHPLVIPEFDPCSGDQSATLSS